MKKFFITLMCIIMVVCFMPTVAMAAEGEFTTVTDVSGLQDALQAGGNIQLGGDITISEKVDLNITNAVVLDLAGCTLNKTYVSSNHYFMVVNGGSLTVMDSSEAKTGVIQAEAKWGYGIQLKGSNSSFILESGTIKTHEESIDINDYAKGASITISGGKLKSTADSVLNVRGTNTTVNITGGELESNGRCGVYISNYGEPEDIQFTMTGGTLSHEGGNSGAIQLYRGATVNIGETAKLTSTNQVIQVQENTVLNVSGGEIASIGKGYAAISAADESTVNISGGEISSTSTSTSIGVVTAEEGAIINISGGNISGEASCVYTRQSYSGTQNPTVNITGGDFETTGNKNSTVTANAGTVAITGGTFSKGDVSQYVPEGTKVVDNDNGTFTLAPAGDAVAQVGDAGFTSLEVAINAAATGQTVKLLDDVTLTETQNVAKNITIDFDTHSITGNDVRVFNVQNGTLTLTGFGTITSRGGETLNYASSVIRVGKGTDEFNGEKVSASLIIGENIVIDAPDTYGVTVFGSHTTETVTVYGKVQCSSTHVGDAAAISGLGSAGYGGTTINIEPGAVVCSDNDVAIYHPQAGVLNIKGGTISGKGGIEAKAGTINITGTPTITATDKEIRYEYNGNGTSTSGYAIAVVENSGYAGGTQVNISGGTYTGAVEVVKDSNVEAGKKGAISITGGTFSTDPTEYVPANSNYRVRTNINGTYTVYHYTPYVPSIPTDSLKTARTEAIKAVTDYINPADYEEAQQAEIKTIVDNAKKDIEAAKTADEIKAIEAAAKAELDKLKTAEEMALIRAIEETKFVARSKAVTLKNGKKAIKITWYDKNGKEVKFDGVEIFRSTKRYSGYGKEPIYVSKSGVYYNTAITPGTKYYYKVRGYVTIDGEKVYTDYSTKAWRTVK